MPFIEHLEPMANADPDMNVDQPPNGWFQLSIAISLKRIADALEAGGAVTSSGAALITRFNRRSSQDRRKAPAMSPPPQHGV